MGAQDRNQDRLGRYVVRRRLGSGGFATVWLAYDEQLDAEVAIKVLADNWVDDDSVRRRFLEEGRFLRRVESEHVVQVHDVGELDDGRPFLVLTYADRGTLADRLREKPLTLDAAVGVVVQIGRGLQALHRRGLLHRDVKPANVLFRSTDDGERAVLSDLGLGKSLDEVSRITLPGGTPSYVAPEQAMGERLDPRADLYSLGAVAYAALTGRSPHQLDGLGAAGRVQAPPPPSSQGAAGVPDRIDRAILRALEPEPDKRWADVDTFTRELIGGLNETTRELDLPAATGGESELKTIVTGHQAPISRSSVHRPDLANRRTDQQSVDRTVRPVTVVPATARKPRRRRRRAAWIVAAVIVAAFGAGGGFVGQRYLSGTVVEQVGGTGITAHVPRTWARHVSDDTWLPAGAKVAESALRASENSEGDGDGVFAGVMAGNQLPQSLPTHPCTGPSRDDSTVNSLDAVTWIYTECPGDSAIIERAVRTANDKILWVQVRADDREQALRIADSVSYDDGGL